MRISRINHIVTCFLTFVGTTVLLPAQTVDKQQAPVTAELTGGDGSVNAVSASLPSPNAESAPVKERVKVTVDRLNVRARPGTSYEVVAKVNRDETLTVVGHQGDWLEIVPPADTAAWCSTKFISDDNKVTGHQVRVRSGPGIVFSAFATLPAGTSITPVGGPVGDWQQIKVPTVATVWIHGDFVAPVKPPESAKKDESATDAVTASSEKTKPADETAPVPSTVSENAETASNATHENVDQTAAAVSVTGDDQKKPETDKTPQPEKTPETVAEGTPAPVSISPDDHQATVTKIAKPEPSLTEKEDNGKNDPGTDASEPDPPANLSPDSESSSATDQDGANTVGPTRTVEREGTLMSLQSKATPFVTHVLIRRDGDKSYLVCYLISDAIDLTEWENRRVRVYGKPLNYPGWKTQALKATGITLLFP